MSTRSCVTLPSVEDLRVLPKAAQAGLMCECASLGDIDGVRTLVEAGASVNVGTPYDLRTPLHLAAASGDLEMAKTLIEEYKGTLERDRFGLLPIHDAVQNGHVDLRRYLQNKKVIMDQAADRRVTNSRLVSAETLSTNAESKAEVMSKVFELIVKEGVFSYTTVHAEVQYFFNGLDLPPKYFEHFTPIQVAKHVHCLIAAKHVGRATEDMGRMDFTFKTGQSGFFLTTIDCPQATEAQLRTEDKINVHLTEGIANESKALSLLFMASNGPVFPGGKEQLGIYWVQDCIFEKHVISEGETSLDVLASARFLKEKTRSGIEQYQVMMEDVVTQRRSIARVVPGGVYRSPQVDGFALLFGTAETSGRHYFPEISQAMRFIGISPRRYYLEAFANGVYIYSLFFPSAAEEQVQRLGHAILHSTHLQNVKGRSEIIYSNVMNASISHEVGLYLMAATKFVYTFFPKEQYAPEYVKVHKVLDRDPLSQRRLETLYKMCMKELLSRERIYELVQRNMGIAIKLFEDFRAIVKGEREPAYNNELSAEVDAAFTEIQDRQIMKTFLIFNESILLTNFFKADSPGAFAFRLNPKIVLKDRPTSLYPEMPYGIYLICGSDFIGFHVRFRDVARGGIRLVVSRNTEAYERNSATSFEEAYNLALTQQHKNKDIPEGGSKGVILPSTLTGTSPQNPAVQRSCFTRYLNALLDCMLEENNEIFRGHMKGKPELLFFGPDENTAGFMDLGAEIARTRGYPYWKALTTGKSVKLGGVPHDTYGMTTASVHCYVVELLKMLGEEETNITKFQTGGPDGDLGSNEILVSRDKTIGIVDGSGVLYDPVGLDRTELTRLAKRRVTVKEYSRSLLSKNGFLVLVDQVAVTLPDGTQYAHGAELRDTFHLTKYAEADLFVPCGGRPNAVTTDNVKHLFRPDGKPKFRMIVEGANLFFSAGAREVLENAGVHHFKDASTNKGGVTSSSLEVLSALALPPQNHSKLMCYNPADESEPPLFYQQYVQQILNIVMENAKHEFHAIWACHVKHGMHKQEATRSLSMKINQITDSVSQTLALMPEQEKDHLMHIVLNEALPPLIVENLGIDGILKRVPSNYIASIVAAWIASRFVYKYSVDTSEVGFFLYMRELMEKPIAAEKAA